MFFFTVAFATQPTVENPKQVKQQIDQLNNQISRIQQSLNQKRGQQSKVSRELESLDKSISHTGKQLHWIKSEHKRLNAQIKESKQKRRQLLDDKTRHQSALHQQVRSAYFSGRQEYVKLLLNQQQPEKLGRLLAYYQYLNNARMTNIDSLSHTIRELLEIEQVIEQKAEKLATLEHQQQQEFDALARQKKQRDAYLATLSQQIASNDSKLGSLVENQSQLSELLAGIQHLLKQQNLASRNATFQALKGKMRWPVKGAISNTFESSTDKIHKNGVMIKAREGDNVTAVHQGRVIFSDWLRGFGLVVIIDHGDGYMSLYGHNESVYKNPGDWIEAGETLGSVGISGGQHKSGLYFEIRHQGRPKNPTQWFRNS